MGAIGFKNSAEQLRKRGKATSSDFMRTNSDGAFRIGIGKPLAGTSNNPKTLNNGLGYSVAKENAGNSINVPQKKRTLI